MKHFTAIDYDYFLNELQSIYPFSIDEAVLVELIANSLDKESSVIDLRLDPAHLTLEITDNGRGMSSKEFELYHNFSHSNSYKRKGIGFAWLGAKLALKISRNIITETKEGSFAANPFWGASEWKFERKRPKKGERNRKSQPVWFELDERTLKQSGTRTKLYLRSAKYKIIDSNEVERIILRHFYPLICMDELYDFIKLYKPLKVSINGKVIDFQHDSAERYKEVMLRRGRERKPFAFARFELHPKSLPEEIRGIAIATYGKIVRRTYFKECFRGMERVTGLIEVPDLVNSLTANKCDFIKDGSTGALYNHFYRIASKEFKRWTETLQL